MHLSNAQTLSLQNRQSDRTCRNSVIQLPDPSVQRGEVKRIALAQLHSLMAEMSGFTAKLIMNFKIHLIVHHCPCL